MSKNRTPNPFPGLPQSNRPQTNHPDPGVIPPYTPPIPKDLTVGTKKFWEGQKAGTNGCLVVMVVDESGSMGTLVDDVIGGYNNFLDEQAKDSIQTYVSLVKFESPQIKQVYKMQPVETAPRLNRELYRPGGMTNLLDAVGQSIEDVDAILAEHPESERPSVIMVVQTDGHENASRSFTKELVKSLIEDREKKDWIFTFLGANIDAFAEGSSFGFGAHNTASYDVANMAATYSGISSSVTRAKMARSKGLKSEEVYTTAMYTDAERNAMKGGDDNA